MMRRARQWVVCLVVLGSSALHAQTVIVRDGTVGPDASLQPVIAPDGVVAIDETMGDRPGGGVNLFHSFATFNLGTGDTALFTADGNLTTLRVISRVTGEASMIDGTFASDIAGADFYFLNPRGVVFGENARLDVPGSFFASTADTLVMLEDDPQGAATFSGDVRLAMAEPRAFGFLGQPVTLSVDGATLKVDDAQTLSLTGGEIDIRGGATLRAVNGRIEVGAAGAASAAGATVPTNTPLDIEGWTPGPDGILSIRGSTLNATGDGDGSVGLAGDAITLRSTSVAADLAGGKNNPAGDAVTIAASGALTFDGASVSVTADGNRKTGAVNLRAHQCQSQSGKPDRNRTV